MAIKFKKGKEISCDNCFAFFYRVNSQMQRRNFCSRKCYSVFAKNDPAYGSWNKGIVRSDEYKKKQSELKKTAYATGAFKHPLLGKKRLDLTAEKNSNWRGDKVSYRNLHRWVERKLGKPDTCEFCESHGLSQRQIHWANKSREYKRDLSDWIRLCVSCHKAYDSNKNLALVSS